MDDQNKNMFPVDESTLMAVEHALGGSLEYDEDKDDFYVVGAEYSFPTLMEFLSGVTEDDYVEEFDTDFGEFITCTKPLFHQDDIIEALIAEVRRLRELVPDHLKEVS